MFIKSRNLNISRKYSKSPDYVLHNMFIFKSLKFFRTAILDTLQSHFAKIAHKVAKSKYFSKLKLNRNLQRIPFKMMYNMSMLRHQFSNERLGGGEALNHLPLLLFCKSVYKDVWIIVLSPNKTQNFSSNLQMEIDLENLLCMF